MVLSRGNGLAPFAFDDEDSCKQQHNQSDACKNYDRKKTGVSGAPFRGGVIPCWLDLGFFR